MKPKINLIEKIRITTFYRCWKPVIFTMVAVIIGISSAEGKTPLNHPLAAQCNCASEANQCTGELQVIKFLAIPQNTTKEVKCASECMDRFAAHTLCDSYYW